MLKEKKEHKYFIFKTGGGLFFAPQARSVGLGRLCGDGDSEFRADGQSRRRLCCCVHVRVCVRLCSCVLTSEWCAYRQRHDAVGIWRGDGAHGRGGNHQDIVAVGVVAPLQCGAKAVCEYAADFCPCLCP